MSACGHSAVEAEGNCCLAVVATVGTNHGHHETQSRQHHRVCPGFRNRRGERQVVGHQPQPRKGNGADIGSRTHDAEEYSLIQAVFRRVDVDDMRFKQLMIAIEGTDDHLASIVTVEQGAGGLGGSVAEGEFQRIIAIGRGKMIAGSPDTVASQVRDEGAQDGARGAGEIQAGLHGFRSRCDEAVKSLEINCQWRWDVGDTRGQCCMG